MRLAYFTTMVIVTLVRSSHFSPAATETLVYTKENHRAPATFKASDPARGPGLIRWVDQVHRLQRQ